MKRAVQLAVRVFVTTVFVSVLFNTPKDFAWSAPQTRLTDLIAVTDGNATLPFAASHVVVRWTGEESAYVNLRTKSADGSWTPWVRATAEAEGFSANANEEGRDSISDQQQTSEAVYETGPVVVNDARDVELQVLSGVANDIYVAAIDTKNGPRHLEAVDNSSNAASALGGSTEQPPIISRSQWGADESLRRGSPEFAPINRIVVHHTATANADPNPAGTVRAIYAWHTSGNGWNDIGYNFLIDQNGQIYEGRYARNYAAGEKPTAEATNGQGVIGAHAVGANVGTIGISMLGTFSNVAPTAAQQSSLVRLMAWETDRHGMNPMGPGVIAGHRDVGQTECPGNTAYAMLPQWRQQTAAAVTLSVPAGNTPGYWVAHSDGGVSNYGSAAALGSMAGGRLNAPVVSMTATSSKRGYWLLGGDGGIFSFGDAAFYGSTGAMRLNAPIVGMAATPSGRGYWLVASDGGIFSFGDARFFGSTGSIRLNQPVVGMASTKSGNGYWLVASDGGVFSFGDATFAGSTGSIKLNSPVTTIAPDPDGRGYWLMAGDGGVFAFESAFMGSIPMLGLRTFGGVAQAAPTSTGKGYYVLSRDGGVYTFGDAKFWGAPSGRNSASIAVLPE